MRNLNKWMAEQVTTKMKRGITKEQALFKEKKKKTPGKL